MYVKGKIVLVKIGNEHEMLSILTNDGVVVPIMDYFLKRISDISDIKERIFYFKSGSVQRILTIKCDDVENHIELKRIEFRMNIISASSRECDYDVSIRDSITDDIKVKDMLLTYLNKDVELTLTLNIK